jgi:hypothetical protein
MGNYEPMAYIWSEKAKRIIGRADKDGNFNPKVDAGKFETSSQQEPIQVQPPPMTRPAIELEPEKAPPLPKMDELREQAKILDVAAPVGITKEQLYAKIQHAMKS